MKNYELFLYGTPIIAIFILLISLFSHGWFFTYRGYEQESGPYTTENTQSNHFGVLEVRSKVEIQNDFPNSSDNDYEMTYILNHWDMFKGKYGNPIGNSDKIFLGTFYFIGVGIVICITLLSGIMINLLRYNKDRKMLIYDKFLKVKKLHMIVIIWLSIVLLSSIITLFITGYREFENLRFMSPSYSWFLALFVNILLIFSYLKFHKKCQRRTDFKETRNV